jgi:hypothetical protein
MTDADRPTRMYAVVGCGDCRALWVLDDPQAAETATCPRCRTRHRTDSLRRFAEFEAREAAREARAAMLADRADQTDAFETTPSVAEMESETATPVVDDAAYLEEKGVDPDAVADAAGDDAGGPTSRPEVVRAALRVLDSPTEGDVVAYAAERGVPEDAARELLERLVRRGDATERDGTYRPL